MSNGKQEKRVSNRNIVKEGVLSDGLSLRDVPERYRDDDEIVVTAVTNSGWELRYASERIRDDKNIVQLAIACNAKAIKYASDRLRTDRELVETAVGNDGDAFEWIGDRWKLDKNIVLIAVRDKPWLLCRIDDRWKTDTEVLVAAVQSDPRIFVRFSNEIEHYGVNYEVVEAGLRQTAGIWRFLTEEEKCEDRYISLALSAQDWKDEMEFTEHYYANVYNYIQYDSMLYGDAEITLKMIQLDIDFRRRDHVQHDEYGLPFDYIYRFVQLTLSINLE